ncbi:hypothetical protein CAI21_13440 [Alkalilimnicola ehrlichii]|uniref:LUD domain-containing protein n=1 Tax=Alkalilimnicola ehrlichii TaxID=351052 RepID=A0A3E0WFZ2_9GAMM|nr:lactate utilization protein [Alkalilimnicola ehrlichii]RFA28309.1 hypothetical protein CAI21_13440 [Alkalilimnicola ehrlichii]RFA31648.1 hypothetical protein CAL65_21895 [Alkalilimnicola ehrlichii]
MNGSKEAILERIRRSQGNTKRDLETARQARKAIAPVLPKQVDTQEQAQFLGRLELAGASWEQLAGASEIPQAAARFCSEHGLPKRIVLGDHAFFRDLPWDSEWECLSPQPQYIDGALAITLALAGIAETGSLATTSTPEQPTTLNFLPDQQLVVLPAGRIVDSLETLWGRLRASGLPRTVNLVTGPSRTADIEQTIQLGAHGPRQLHVILLPS